MTETRRRVFTFGMFRLDPGERLLLCEGEAVSLTPKVFDTLVWLVEHHGQLVEKDDFMKRLWPDTFVEESTLTANISVLRRALRDGSEGLKFIETLPKRGYRFVAPVTERWEDVRASAAPMAESADPANHIRSVGPPAPTATAGAAAPIARRFVLVAAIVITVSTSAFVYLWRSDAAAPTVNAPIRSLAVLPFTSLNTPGDDVLGIGMADALIMRLSNVRQLAVRPTRAVLRYARVDQDPIAAGREQRVDALLDGSIQTSDGRVRVTVRLVRVGDGTTLWGGSFDESVASLLTVQDIISERVARAVVAELSGNERQLLGMHQTENPTAYQAYLRGRYFWNKRTADGYTKAIENFQEAVVADPRYAAAHAGLADSYLLIGGYQVIPPKEAMLKARSAVERALQLDEALAEAHATKALIAQNGDWNWKEAEREYRRAIELNQNYATAHHWYGEFLALMGRPGEGEAEMKKALDLDPLSLAINTDLAGVYYRARQFNRAVDQLKRTIEMDPHFALTHNWLASIYETQGRYQEALEEVGKLATLQPGPSVEALSGRVFAGTGKTADAMNAIASLNALSKRQYVSPFDIAAIYVRLGDKQQAFDGIEKEYREHSSQLIGLKVDPFFDSLRSDPRFDDLLRRMNFE